LAIAGGGGWAECAVETGRLTAISGDRAWIGSAQGETARVACRLPEGLSGAALGLDLETPDAAGASAGAAFERVEADGRERFRFDLSGKSGTSWRRIALAGIAEEPPRGVVVA